MMTKGQHDSENQVFSKQKGETFKNIRNMKDGQPRSWSNSLQIYPSKGHPITHSETRGSMHVAGISHLSGSAPCCESHWSGVDGALDLFWPNLPLRQATSDETEVKEGSGICLTS